MVFDEPTTGLNPKTANELESELFSLNTGVVLVTHHYNEEIFAQSDEIMIVDNGEIIQSGNYQNKAFKKAVEKR
jgi:ABC-type multidrug transport system ATPase subunit